MTSHDQPWSERLTLLELHTVVMKAIHLDGVNFFNTRLLGTSDRI